MLCAGSRQDKNHPPSLKALIGHFFAPCRQKWAPCPPARAARRGGSARRWCRYRTGFASSDTRCGCGSAGRHSTTPWFRHRWTTTPAAPAGPSRKADSCWRHRRCSDGTDCRRPFPSRPWCRRRSRRGTLECMTADSAPTSSAARSMRSPACGKSKYQPERPAAAPEAGCPRSAALTVTVPPARSTPPPPPGAAAAPPDAAAPTAGGQPRSAPRRVVVVMQQVHALRGVREVVRRLQILAGADQHMERFHALHGGAGKKRRRGKNGLHFGLAGARQVQRMGAALFCCAAVEKRQLGPSPVPCRLSREMQPPERPVQVAEVDVR